MPIYNERRAGYEPNHESIAAFLVSKRVRDVAIKAAKDVQRIAAATSPNYSNNRDRSLRESWRVNENPGFFVTRNGNPHAFAQVFNGNKVAAGNEFGNRRIKTAHHTLLRAGAMVGEVGGKNRVD